MFKKSYKPKINFSWTKKNIVSILIEMQKGKSIFRSIADLVENCLNANIGSYIPDFDYFIGA
jgi:hypothetical protein